MDKKALLSVAALASLITAGVFKLLSLAPIQPEAAAVEAVIVDSAYSGLIYLTVPVYGIVTAFVLYSLWRFRARSEKEQGRRFDRSQGRVLETLWVVGTLVMTLGLAAYGARELRALRGDEKADIDIQVGASQFSWEFFYPSYGEFSSRLYLPRGKRARLILSSKDVVHSFWVPQFRVKQDAVPGKVVRLLLTPTKNGVYEVLCAELCGLEHTQMTALVEVIEPEELDGKIKGEAWN